MGYRSNNFARNLRTRRTHTIGVIIPRLNSYFMSTVIAGIESIANSEGYNLLISQSSESAQKEKAQRQDDVRQPRGTASWCPWPTTRNRSPIFEAFIKKNIPLIFFDRVAEHNDCTSILINNKKAAYEAATPPDQPGTPPDRLYHSNPQKECVCRPLTGI